MKMIEKRECSLRTLRNVDNIANKYDHQDINTDRFKP